MRRGLKVLIEASRIVVAAVVNKDHLIRYPGGEYPWRSGPLQCTRSIQGGYDEDHLLPGHFAPFLRHHRIIPPEIVESPNPIQKERG